MISHHNRIRGRKPKQKRRRRTGWFNKPATIRLPAPFLPASPLINGVRMHYWRGSLVPRNEP
jgi:hypothetical protein